MAEISESAVRKVLETVIDPATGRNVVASGMVSGVATRGGHVAVTLEVDPARGPALEPLRQACEQAIRAMPDVLSASAVMTAERAASALPVARRQGFAPGHAAAITAIAWGGFGRGLRGQALWAVVALCDGTLRSRCCAWSAGGFADCARSALVT